MNRNVAQITLQIRTVVLIIQISFNFSELYIFGSPSFPHLIRLTLATAVQTDFLNETYLHWLVSIYLLAKSFTNPQLGGVLYIWNHPCSKTMFLLFLTIECFNILDYSDNYFRLSYRYFYASTITYWLIIFSNWKFSSWKPVHKIPPEEAESFRKWKCEE